MSTAQTFPIPAVTGDGNAATWSLSDPTQAHLQPQSFESGGATLPGVMITMRARRRQHGPEATGTVTVIATEAERLRRGGAHDHAEHRGRLEHRERPLQQRRNNLHIDRPPTAAAVHFDHDPTVASPEGGVPEGGFGGGGFHLPDGGSYYETDGGTACTNCHGPTATNCPYKDVSHTPEQTGGFSDTDLQNIICTARSPTAATSIRRVLNTNCDAGTVYGPGTAAMRGERLSTVAPLPSVDGHHLRRAAGRHLLPPLADAGVAERHLELRRRRTPP